MKPPPPHRDDPYSHRFHAGNVGDVWKHVGLALLLRALRAGDARRVHYLDTHAGEGRYALGPTGEWSEGVGRLWPPPPAVPGAPAETAPGPAPPSALATYRRDVLALGEGQDRPRRYPGSPCIAAAILGSGDRLSLWERDDNARRALATALGDDPRVTLAGGDGFAALPGALAASRRDTPEATRVVLVDPPYADKHEWRTAAEAVAAAHRADPAARILLWYPVKSLTRPNTLHAALRDGGVPAAVLELVTTPLEHRRNRLNGSGLVLVNPPDGLLPTLAAGLATLGPGLATQPGRWSARLLAWESDPGAP